MAVPLTLAVAEDHDELRSLAVELLQAQGHRVACLNCAEEPDLAAEPPPDVFVIELRRPGEDGWSLAERVRAAHPRAGIVMVTAGSSAADAVDRPAQGAHLYLLEPVTPLGLIDAVRTLAKRWPAPPTPDTLPADAPHNAPDSTSHITPTNNTASASPQPLALDTTQLCLIGPRGTVGLTPAEAALIEALAKAPRQQLGLARIADAVGVPLQQLSKASLQVRVVRLRRKLGEAGAGEQAIKAVRGYGYQLCARVLLRA